MCVCVSVERERVRQTVTDKHVRMRVVGRKASQEKDYMASAYVQCFSAFIFSSLGHLSHA